MQGLLDTLMERARDETSYTRAAVCRTWAGLAESGKVPMGHWTAVTNMAIGALSFSDTDGAFFVSAQIERSSAWHTTSQYAHVQILSTHSEAHVLNNRNGKMIPAEEGGKDSVSTQTVWELRRAAGGQERVGAQGGDAAADDAAAVQPVRAGPGRAAPGRHPGRPPHQAGGAASHCMQARTVALVDGGLVCTSLCILQGLGQEAVVVVCMGYLVPSSSWLPCLNTVQSAGAGPARGGV